jgi:hypothetical protein
VTADGAYDRASVYRAIEEHPSHDPPPTRVLIPPERNAKSSDDLRVDSEQRNVNTKHIARHGRRQRQKASGYTLRSLVETAMSRVKNQFGGALRSRTIQTRETEVRIACSILNTMTMLGMPDGHRAS